MTDKLRDRLKDRLPYRSHNSENAGTSNKYAETEHMYQVAEKEIEILNEVLPDGTKAVKQKR